MGDDAVRDDAVEKELLNRYLRKARRELLGKLDGLSEEQVRWPMTGTGTNLLGLVKHVASVEIDYFGAVFDRPAPRLPWTTDDAPVNADMWATEEESRASILELIDGRAGSDDGNLPALEVEQWAHHRERLEEAATAAAARWADVDGADS